MAAGKEIRGKIKSVENTKKITKAMEMVAASKMRKAQDRMRAARPYSDKIRNIAANLGQIGNTTSDGYTQLLMKDTRYTATTYYKFCLKTVASGDGNSATGLHVYYLNSTAAYPTNCLATQLWFAPS